MKVKLKFIFTNNFYYISGLFFLLLSKARNSLKGYSNPKPFGVADYEKCYRYDIQVVDDWLLNLKKYTKKENYFLDKNVLELGPGSDLGIGLYLISKGIAQYNACDVNDLVKTAPDSFYNYFIDKLKASDRNLKPEILTEQLKDFKSGKNSKIKYVVKNDFDLISAFGNASIDLVFSHAAFEHLDDVEATVFQLSSVCKSGAVIIAVIDLQTHSRWIREKDPNNIYRYSEGVYKILYTRGIPNRVRPYKYKLIFESLGWTDVTVSVLSINDSIQKTGFTPTLLFKDEANQLDCLSVLLCARRK